MGVPPLTNDTENTSGNEGLVKIRPSVAEQSRQKKKKQNAPQNIRRRLRIAASWRRRLLKTGFH